LANRFNTLLPSQKYISTYAPIPFDEILKVGALQQQRQDEAEEDRMKLLGKSWNRLPGDTQRSKELQNEINSKLAQFADKNFNDPNVKNEWYKTKLDLAKQFSPNGEIGAQQANYDAYKAYEKNILSKSEELGWSTQQIQQHLNQAKNSFMTRGKSGDLNYFQGSGLATRVDTTKWLADNLKNVADETGITQLKKYGSLNEVTDAFVKGEINHKDYNKIINSLSKLAKGDQELMNSLEQEGLFSGQQGRSKFIKGVDEDGNVQLDPSNPFALQLSGLAEGAQYQKLKQEYITAKDPIKEYIAKKAFDEAEFQKQMQWTILRIPTDPNNPTNNDAGVNLALKSSGSIIGNNWNLVGGHLQMIDPNATSTFNINGKLYTYEDLANQGKNLPEGYRVATKSTGTGIELFIKGPKGEEIKPSKKTNLAEQQFKAFQELITVGNRLGLNTSNREDLIKGVEDYYKNANNFQMNFTRFDEGTTDALSKAFGVTTKTNSDGEQEIVNPGQLAFSTIKSPSGQPLTGKDLIAQKTEILSGAKLLGPAQSLTNSNFEAGDMYIQAKNGNVYLMNSNNKSLNDRLTPSTNLVKSIDKYVNTGERSMSKEETSKLDSLYPGTQFAGMEKDTQGNIYYSFIKSIKDEKSGEIKSIPGVLRVDTQGNPNFLELDEASKMLSQDYVQDILPSYNTKNFDRFTKTNQFDTEE